MARPYRTIEFYFQPLSLRKLLPAEQPNHTSAAKNPEQGGLGERLPDFLFFTRTSNSEPSREGKTCSPNQSHNMPCL